MRYGRQRSFYTPHTKSNSSVTAVPVTHLAKSISLVIKLTSRPRFALYRFVLKHWTHLHWNNSDTACRSWVRCVVSLLFGQPLYYYFLLLLLLLSLLLLLLLLLLLYFIIINNIIIIALLSLLLWMLMYEGLAESNASTSLNPVIMVVSKWNRSQKKE